MNPARTVCTREEWLAARKELLVQEKQFTHLRDQLSERRRALPWVRIDREYAFEGPRGVRSLAELFDGRAQLLVYHLMFAPEWEAACKSCSFWADNFDGALVHLAHRDVSFAAISRAPFAKLRAYQQRMGWSFPWLSAGDGPFNYDYGVSFQQQEITARAPVYNFGTQRPQSSDMPGFSVFYKDAGGDVYHTYSCYARGIDMMNVTYQYLDLVPKGRDEAEGAMAWLRRHDEYAR